MRNLIISLALPASMLAGTLTAQERPAKWALRVEIARDAFTGASRDTTQPAAAVEVGPAPRMALELGLTRALGGWEIGVSAGYASGGLRARTDVVALDDRSSDVSRFRAALLLSRRVTRLGSVELYIAAGPSLDHWRASGIGNRTTLGGRGGLTLRIPLGAVSLENTVRFGLSGSPFRARNLPPEAEVLALHTWSVGVGLVIPLGR